MKKGLRPVSRTDVGGLSANVKIMILETPKNLKGKTVGRLVQIAQTHVNAYIRARDNEGGYCKCISCGRYMPMQDIQAGHYFPAGHYTALRYDYENINGQCLQCNYFKHGAQEGYREGLIRKIGIDRVKTLELRANASRSHKWSRTELLFIIQEAKQKIKEL